MQLIWFFAIGFVAGLVARAVLPSRLGRSPTRAEFDAMSLGMTTFVGVVGALLGGFLATLFARQPVGLSNPTGLLGSIAGAFVLLTIYGALFSGASRAGRPRAPDRP